jgi:hypothetical protein
MEALLAQGLVAGLLFITVYLIGKRLTGAAYVPDDTDEQEADQQRKMFSIGGKQLIGAGVIAGLGSMGAHVLLTAKLKPVAAVFVQDPPF